jgi:membrane-associated phospholipid phosphatase
MLDCEARKAWQLYLYNWIPLGGMVLLLALCLAVSKFSLRVESTLLKAVGTAALCTTAAHFAVSRNWGARLPFVLGSFAQLGLLFLLATPLIYIAAATNLPMQDANLAHFDRMLGLDWPSYLNFVNDRPWLIPYMYLGYAMITWPMFGVPIILGMTGHYRCLQQFTLACMLTVVLTALVSTLLPAIGTYHEYGIIPDLMKFRPSGYLVQLHDLPRVRDGSLRILETSTLGGIITFPSFHAAAAVLALWGLWCVWWLRPLALIANVSMLLATPLIGGHYFVDVIAGAGLSVLAIAAARLIGEWSIQPVAQPVARTAPAAVG